MYTHKSAPTHGLSPDCRTNRDLDHAPLKLNTQSRCHVHLNRVDTLFVCGACNVRMCPIPCFQRYHFMSEYKFNDTTKKSKAPKKKSTITIYMYNDLDHSAMLCSIFVPAFKNIF